MNCELWLKRATALLTAAGIKTARLDSLLLLEDILGKDRAWLLAHPEHELTQPQTKQLAAKLDRRARHEPLAYIRGHAEFYGRTFITNVNVLVPRPETEAVIELSKQLIQDDDIERAADIGTGSGCIGITLRLECPALAVDLYDLSSDALVIAKQNARHLHANVGSYNSDLLARLHGDYDLLVTNLPYVPDDFPVNEAARFEPALALFSGSDGMDHYRTFWSQVAALPHMPRFVVIESFPRQHEAQATLAQTAGYALIRTLDFAQAFTRS